MRLNKNIKIILNYFVGPVVFLFLAYSIRQQLMKQPDWQHSWKQVQQAWPGPQQWKAWIVLLLMMVNWGLEARKWQLAIRPVQRIPFGRAFQATLTGTTMASFTPNRMGEYLGRILYIDEGKRVAAISLTIVCSISQLLVTLVAGAAGLLYLRHILAESPSAPFVISHGGMIFLIIISLVTGFVLTMIYFRLSRIVNFFIRRKTGLRVIRFLKILEDFNATVLLRILFLSFVRYLVFIAQYFLLFAVFGVSLTWAQAAGGMSVVFLVMAVIPTFTFLTELGLRWTASIKVIELFSVNGVGILTTAFGIWLINLVIPALIGSLLILNIKLFRNK